jgi:hypothetical protein
MSLQKKGIPEKKECPKKKDFDIRINSSKM